MSVRIDTQKVVDDARAATGLSDFGEDSWQEGLERLADSLASEGALNELGFQIAQGEATMYLANRLGIIDYRKQHPEIASVDVRPPIVIVGQGRTGTTILHDLLAQDPANRVPLTWEVDRPCPPPERATYDTDPRIAEVDATTAGVELLIPGFLAMHPMGARLPQECVRMTVSDFRSIMFPTQYRVPSYGKWIVDEADMAPAYRWHRIYLQHLQSRHPAARWVLKSPAHIWCLADLLHEYPDALLVQTHRDPVRIISSLSSLVALLRRIGSDSSTIPDAASEFADYVIEGLDRSVTARDDGTVKPDRVVDVQFRAFMADPFTTIRTIYERLGLELEADAEARMRAFLAAHPSDEHGTHTYTFADTELSEGELRDRSRRYTDYFAIEAEPV
ncbi:MAG TPA: sulfotransferase [Acidimicrobiia bacterium]|nr:sulfotransferase [Acidimicrobiia bacterium]